MTVPAEPQPEAASPCVFTCVIDQGHGYCLGCWRTLAEISAWHRYNTNEKYALLAQLETRCAAHSPTPATP